MTPAAIVSKLGNYCNVLPDDGMSYGDYVFLKGRRGPDLNLQLLTPWGPMPFVVKAEPAAI